MYTIIYPNMNTDHFERCKQHWSRSTSCFSFLPQHKSWDKIQPTEHIKLNQKVKQTGTENNELKQEVFLDQCLHLAMDSHYTQKPQCTVW